ncbi:ImpA family type VI secretion system protein [Paraburkholderia sp. J67]|uniref:type VI secretion system protein TssA n=1 Tax=Paraburkholderia sp. J67 TaxID=2805435 RepID=UPI002ABE1196|nr:type VI secretion system ImpA family N-terminal domain-containing protein [Paraburkholderia sp. J67]
MSGSKKSPQDEATPIVVHDWMAHVRDDAPCGVDLEYDPEFVVLGANMVAKADAQYGNFVGTPEPVNWGDVDRDCRRLMLRSKDIRLAVLFTRCCTRLRSATGLAEGLALLTGWLNRFPEHIHPQPDVDEDRTAALEIRMNALQSLTDPQGLLSDVREIVLARSTAMRLQVRDVERAFARPRPDDALSPESVKRQLEDLRVEQPSLLADFDEALRGVMAIEAWSREHLSLHVPDLSCLKRLLLSVGAQEEIIAATVIEAIALADVSAEGSGLKQEKCGIDKSAEGMPESIVIDKPDTPATESPVVRAFIKDRSAVLSLIREARHWFEQHEPSSPIPLLLRRAEQCAGKRFAELVNVIPAELLGQWDRDGQSGE